VVALLLTLLLLAAAALPDDVPAEGLDLCAYYFDNARHVWTLFTIFLVLAAIVGRAAPASLFISQLANLVVAVVAASLAIVRRRAYHAILVR
jgi:hypothetical protein